MIDAPTIEKAKAELATDGSQARLFSGHESFPCRYGWLVKLYHALEENSRLFTSDETAILALGLGKNMVKSIRFWGQAFGLTDHHRGETFNTELAHCIMDPVSGMDPYLEEIGTLWRLHWQISTHAGLGAWVIAFQDVLDARITRSRLIDLTEIRAASTKGAISRNTAATHVDILLRTYDWSRSDPLSVAEEGSGCPFQELKLVETEHTNGDVTVTFNRGPKQDFRLSDMAFALYDFWTGTAPRSDTLSLRSLQMNKRGPGSIFRLNEGSLHVLLEELAEEAAFNVESDGVGGYALVARNSDHLKRLEAVAWQNN